jgi:hypothetical protein
MPKLSRYQRKIFNHLVDLKDHLEKVQITVNDSEEFNLFEWFDVKKDCSNVAKVSLNDSFQTTSANLALNCCIMFISFLEECFESKGWVRMFLSWFNDSIGSIEYMRSDLLNRFKCTEFKVRRGKAIIDW